MDNIKYKVIMFISIMITVILLCPKAALTQPECLRSLAFDEKNSHDVEIMAGPTPEEIPFLQQEMMIAIVENKEQWIRHVIYWADYNYSQPLREKLALQGVDEYQAMTAAINSPDFHERVRAFERRIHDTIMDDFRGKFKDKYPLLCRYADYYYYKIGGWQSHPENGLEVLWERVLHSRPIHFPNHRFTAETVTAWDEMLPFYDKIVTKPHKKQLLKKIESLIGAQALINIRTTAENDPEKIHKAAETFKRILAEDEGAVKQEAAVEVKHATNQALAAI